MQLILVATAWTVMLVLTLVNVMRSFVPSLLLVQPSHHPSCTDDGDPSNVSPCWNHNPSRRRMGEQPLLFPNHYASSSSLVTWSSTSTSTSTSTCNCTELQCQPISNNSSDSQDCQRPLSIINGILDSLDDSNNTCNAHFVQEFLPNPYWERYQLADWFKGVIFYRQRYYNQSKGLIQQEWSDHHSTYKGSLADDYHKASLQHNVQAKNYQVLYQVVKERIQQTPHHERPGPGTLVIHLRLGDVIDGSLDSVQDFLLDQQYFYRKHHAGDVPRTPWEAPNALPLKRPWNAYVRPLHHYCSVLQQVLLSNASSSSSDSATLQQQEENGDVSSLFRSVVLMGSAHMGQLATNMSATKSCHYTKALQAYLANIVPPHVMVSLRLGQDPDDDVVFATQADHFVESGGGFSRLIATLQSMMRAEREQNKTATAN